MANISPKESSAGDAGDGAELRRLLRAPRRAPTIRLTSGRGSTPATSRVFDVDASFDSGGTWAGVDQLVEAAYLGLLEIEQEAIVEEHLYELYMVLPAYRDRIRPKCLCLTDTAPPDEQTRFYPLDRAHRIVNGVVGLVLQWKRALRDRSPWVVIVRNFDRAEHLATRFYTELARRSEIDGEIAVIIATRYSTADFAMHVPGMQIVPAEPRISDVRRASAAQELSAREIINEVEIRELLSKTLDRRQVLFEQNYNKLLSHYRQSGDNLAAAQIALDVLVLYARYGYYYEAKSFLPMITPYFDDITNDNEMLRVYYISNIYICHVMTGDPASSISTVKTLSARYLTDPRSVSESNYMVAIYYLRYAEEKDFKRAEEHFLRAVGLMSAESHRDPFRKVFIDNGLAFLRARQGRHQEALDLCKKGYEFLTKEMGDDRHRLHRSVLLYNIAQVYVMIKDLGEGLLYYNKALEMDPNYSEYYNEAGNLLQEMDRYEEAVEYYARAIECSAPYAEVYFNKGVCHARLGSLEQALSCFRKTLELNPDQPVAYALQADVLRELGSVDEALEGYDTAIALGYDSTAVRVNRAALLYNKGAFELALSDMDYVIVRDGEDPAHYENRATIYQAMNRQELYLQDLAAAERCREAA